MEVANLCAVILVYNLIVVIARAVSRPWNGGSL